MTVVRPPGEWVNVSGAAPPRTAPPLPPRHDPEDLLTVAGTHPATEFEPREVLARILDEQG